MKLASIVLLCLGISLVISQPAQGQYESFKIALQQKNYPEVSRLLESIVTQYVQSDFESSDLKVEALVELIEEVKDPLSMVSAYRQIGQIYQRYNHIPEAYDYVKKSIDLAKKFNLPNEQCSSVELLTGIYSELGKNEEALISFLEGASICESVSQEQAAKMYIAASRLQYFSRNYTEAIFLGDKVLALYAKNPAAFSNTFRAFDQMDIWNTMGLAYRNLKEYDKSIKAFEKAKALAEADNNKFWVGLITGNMGKVYFELGLYNEALEASLLDYNTSLAYKEWSSVAIASLIIGEIYESWNNFTQAEIYYDSAKVNLDRMKPSDQGKTNVEVQFYKRLASISEKMKQYDKAFMYSKLYTQKNDSLTAIQNTAALSRLQSTHEFDKKLAELNLLKKEHQLQTEKLKTKNITLGGSLVGLSLAGMAIYLLFKNNRQKKSTNRLLENKVRKRTLELAKKNRDLNTFLYRSSHDIRRPIASLLGLVHLGDQLNDDPEVTEIFQKVGETAHSMDYMLLKLQAIYEIDSYLSPNYAECEVNKLVSEVAGKFSFEDHNCQFKLELDGTVPVRTDPSLLSIITSCLLENAINHRNPMIKTDIILRSGNEADESFYLEVEDSGLGIDTQYHKKIFEPFFRANPHSQGSGLGLYLVKKASEKLHGTIKLESRSGEGSLFHVTIPKA